MQGLDVEDRLGRTLPPFITRERAIAWAEGSQDATLVAARRWPRQPGRWVVVVADGDDFVSRDVRLAVIEVEADGTVQRIARTLEPLSPTADWSMIPDPFGPTQAAHSFRDSFSLDALDFGAYDLSPSLQAFGIRTERNEGYGGGFGTFEELTLLVIEGDRLLTVASFPIATYTMNAGYWHADGTRSHDTYNAELVVDVRAKPNHMADLGLRSRHSRNGALFVWNESARIYDCSDRQLNAVTSK